MPPTAALANAKLDLEFSTIKAPITGKIGRKLVSPGQSRRRQCDDAR